MQILKSFIILLSFIVLVSSCNTKASGDETPTDPLLIEANSLHLEAMEVEKSFAPMLNELIDKKNSIQVQGRELTQEEINFTSFAEKVEKYYFEWQENRVEVPGFEHDHDHSGHDHHHHHHGNDVKLTPQQMLEVQKQSYEDLSTMKTKVEHYLNK